ncbi:MAG: GtrA family protein, partial [Haloferula sp.]
SLLYCLFALIAISANLGCQWVIGLIDTSRFSFWTALIAGTGAGLVVKYVLDKQFIFEAHHLKRATDISRSFIRYTATGLLTTGVFWGLQLAFHHGFPHWSAAKYVGGGTGLIIGYIWKFRLDRQYTFATS